MLHFHPASELLEQYSMRRASDSQEATIEEHLLICELCRLDLDKLEADIQLMRILLGPLELALSS